MNKPLISRPISGLSGDIAVPGDKSISHRAIIMGGLAMGETRVAGLLEGEDVLNTAAAMRGLGAEVERLEPGAWLVRGRGVGGLAEPSSLIDMGNSGTGVRLLMGVAAAHPFTSFFSGDASLSRRPMERVMAPLRLMGAEFASRSGGRLPLAVLGRDDLLPIEYENPVASAQVKSAVLLAGLHAPGRTTVIEPKPSRDHTELIFRHFGAKVNIENLPDGSRAASVEGQPELAGRDVRVPGDISSAAFPLVATLLVADSRATIRNVGVNPLRTGLLDCLCEMGADIVFSDRRVEAGEPVADLVVRASRLKGIEVPPERAPSMIDEYPILAVAAAFAEGTTRMEGLGELRVKESDRLAVVARSLAACGVRIEEGPDWLAVHGNGRPPTGGARIAVELDHRIAMSFLVMGMAAKEPVTVDDASPIDTSFPGFADLMNGMGAAIGEA